MEQYHFQYTKQGRSLLVLLICFVSVFLSVGICVRLNINKLLTEGLMLIVGVLVFRLVRKIAVFDCTATINENSIAFDFGEATKTFYFIDLISYKYYSGKNAPFLFLNTATRKLRIYANSYFCNNEPLDKFCGVIIMKLDAYRISHNPKLIREGDMFESKKMLYFLNTATIIYLAGFFFETNAMRLAIGMGGAAILGMFWLIYYYRNVYKEGSQ